MDELLEVFAVLIILIGALALLYFFGLLLEFIRYV